MKLLEPIIQELEELARTHPDPSVRANIFHVIDVLQNAGEGELMSVMHQFYHLREQLREEEELRRLRASEEEPAFQMLSANEYTITHDPSTEGIFFQMVAPTDEEEFNELVEAQHVWGMPVGEA